MVGCVAAINVNALCHNGIPAESERTSLRLQAAGRGSRVGEPGAARDRTESGAHRAGEGRPCPTRSSHTSPTDARAVESSMVDRSRISAGTPRKTENLET